MFQRWRLLPGSAPFSYIMVLLLALGCLALTAAFRQEDGGSTFEPLLFLPLILAIIACRLPFVIALAFLLSGTAFWIGLAPALRLSPGPQQTTDLVELCVRTVMMNVVAIFGGVYAQQMRTRQQQIQQQLRETGDLLSVSQWIHASTSLDDAVDIVLLALGQLHAYQSAALFLQDETHARMVAQGVRGVPEERLLSRLVLDRNGLSGTLDWNTPRYVSDVAQAASHPLALLFPNAGSFAVLPLFLSDQTLAGVLYMGFNAPGALAEEDFRRLCDFAERISLPLHQARIQERLQAMAFTDAMTGLPNYGAFRANLDREVRRRTGRYHHPLSLIMLDIDDFKRVNDGYGHPTGDDYLRQLAAILRANLRASDLPARYGGEEFVVICPETDALDALGVAERIRKAVQNRPFPVSELETLPMTVSIGVATFPFHAGNEARLIQQADAALYYAKHNGKNLVALPPQEGPDTGEPVLDTASESLAVETAARQAPSPPPHPTLPSARGG